MLETCGSRAWWKSSMQLFESYSILCTLIPVILNLTCKYPRCKSKWLSWSEWFPVFIEMIMIAWWNLLGQKICFPGVFSQLRVMNLPSLQPKQNFHRPWRASTFSSPDKRTVAILHASNDDGANPGNDSSQRHVFCMSSKNMVSQEFARAHLRRPQPLSASSVTAPTFSLEDTHRMVFNHIRQPGRLSAWRDHRIFPPFDLQKNKKFEGKENLLTSVP